MKDIKEQIRELVKPYKCAEDLLAACENIEEESALIILLKELFDSKLPSKYKRVNKNKKLFYYWSYWYAKYFSSLGFNCYVFSVGSPALHSWVGVLKSDMELKDISQQDMNKYMWCVDSSSCALHNFYLKNIGKALNELGYKEPAVYIESDFDLESCKAMTQVKIPSTLDNEMIRYIDFLINGNYSGEKIPLIEFDKLFNKGDTAIKNILIEAK